MPPSPLSTTMAQTETLDLGFGTLATRQGAHVGAFYRSLDERNAILGSYFRTALAAGDPCLFVSPALTREDYLKAFRTADLPVTRALKSSQLILMNTEDFYMEGGRFDADRVIARERLMLRNAPEGRVLRAAADMSWALLAGVAPEAIETYESRFNREVLPFHMVTALCLYDMNRFGFAWGKAGYNTHPHIVFGEHFFENTNYLKA